MVQELEDFLESRVSSHGDFAVTATLANQLKVIMHTSLNWKRLTCVQKEALDMIEYKVARILSGNPNEPDHWHDIAGYATLAKQNLGPPNLSKIDMVSSMTHGGPMPFCGCWQCEKIRINLAAAVDEPTICQCPSCIAIDATAKAREAIKCMKDE